MSWFSTRRPCRKRDAFAPRVEALEDRCTPTTMFTQSGNTLFITGDATNNNIQIVDSGSGTTANITVFADGQPMFTSNMVTPITRIVLDTGDGNDVVSYQVTNPFSAAMTVTGTLGNGNDQFVGRTFGILQAGSRLNFSINGNAGNDQIYGQFLNSVLTGATLNWTAIGEAGNDVVGLTLQGSLFAGAGLFSNVDLGSGDDTWQAVLRGNLFASSLAVFNASGGVGNDIVGANLGTDHLPGSSLFINYFGDSGMDTVGVFAGLDVDVDVSANLTMLLSGGADADLVLSQYFGRMNGSFTSIMDGGTGNDRIDGVQLLSPGSNPTRSTYITRAYGGDGNDRIRLYVKPNALTAARVNGRVLGGPGFDSDLRSPTVSQSGCEVDIVR